MSFAKEFSDISSKAASAFGNAAENKTNVASTNKSRNRKHKQRKRSSISPITLRLTQEEREKLEQLADGMTLSAYIRACVFAEQAKRRKRRPKNVVEDKKAAAEALALLGQSRIASNLNQLAYHANIGVFIEDEDTKAQIIEANNHLQALRSLLMKALGKNP